MKRKSEIQDSQSNKKAKNESTTTTTSATTSTTSKTTKIPKKCMWKIFIIYFQTNTNTKTRTNKVGIIRCGGKGGRGSGIGYSTVPDSSFLAIPCFSKGNEDVIKGKQLSPFFLGPIEADKEHDTPVCKNFENFWQFSKVYPKVAKQSQKEWKHIEEVHANPKSKDPLPAYFAWRKKGFSSSVAIRRPNGTTRKNGPPFYSLYKGERLSYVESRKKLYQPMYQQLVRKTKAYKDLLELIRKGQNVLLIEPDGPNVSKFPHGREISEKLLEELIEDTTQIYGHGYALASALLEDLNEEK